MTTTNGYLLDSGTDLGHEQLECLEVLLDHHTIASLEQTGVHRGQRCLDLGAGSGSITGWLADRVRPGGLVVAADIETDQLAAGPAIDVRRHDINHGVPSGGPFDLIHARLVLMHLPRRREVVSELVNALAPGGWLVLGEYLGPHRDPIAAPTRADAELFHRVLEVTLDAVGAPGGISYEWAHEVDECLVRAGMENVHTERHIETTAGGETGCILYANYIRQAAPLLLENGLGTQQLERFCELMSDPGFRAWLFEFTSVRAQKPR